MERYRRFAFSDIQAIVVTEVGRGSVWRTAMALFLFVLAVAYRASTFGRDFFGILASIAFVLAITEFARGPRCRCFVQTAVSRERLFCVSRMRTARSVLATVGPAIESVQGNLTLENLAPAPSTGFSIDPLPAPILHPPAIQRTLGYAPEVLFVLLMLDSVLMFIALRSTVGVAFSILPILYFAEFLIGILALVQSRARNTALLIVLIAAFLCVLIDPFVLSGPAIWPSLIPTFRQASTGIISWNIPIRASVNSMLMAAGWRAGIGVAGLLVCYFERTAILP